MSDREDRKNRLARAAGRRAEPDAPPAGTTAVRTKPVRVTLDLSPAAYRRLKTWTLNASVEVGANVSLADVLRTLADHLDTDQELAELVLADLKQRHSET